MAAKIHAKEIEHFHHC